jgi:N-acetylmuramoyl-L-alanine amidase
MPWDRAQEPYISQSLALANQVGTALARAKVPLAMGRVAMRPLDNLMCPAVSIEIATLGGGSDATPVSDEEYQQRVAEAVAGALILWKNQAVQPESVTVPITGGRPGGGD